ncbi:MAG: WecB/TagA/CpsF family glycosyltransferase [Ruminococcaceae bacterium]|nr:WecB/TagA/CpsF family glycosyltransferase [Oscillospiraceae bacterium]
MDKVNILGVWVDKVNIGEAADKIFKMLDENRPHMIFTPNSEILMVAYKDLKFREILNRADMLTADGIGVVYASKILKNPIKERAAGFDITCKVLEKVAESGHKVFFFGGKEGVGKKAKENLEQKYPFIQIVGTRNGYFKPEEEPEIIREINESGADLVLVCLGAPAQEKWIARNIDSLHAKVFMGVGGSLDVLAGTAERAPEFWCNHGIEWLYRLLKQPSRIGRMMALPKFALTVLFKGRRFPQEKAEG